MDGFEADLGLLNERDELEIWRHTFRWSYAVGDYVLVSKRRLTGKEADEAYRRWREGKCDMSWSYTDNGWR